MLIPKKYLAFAAVAVMTAGAAFAGDDPTRFPVLKTAQHHPVQYYLSLPTGWSAAKKWPVILALDASYGDFYGEVDRFVRFRKDAPFIVLVPYLVYSNQPDVQEMAKFHYAPAVWQQIQKDGWLAFDMAAIAAVLAEAQAQYGATGKPFLTGWGGGGGNLAWRLIFSQPDRWAAVAPACPHFQAEDAATVSNWPDRGNLSIKVFQGESDFLRTNADLDPEWDKAKAAADQHGFKVTRVFIPDKYHDQFADQVLQFFGTILKP